MYAQHAINAIQVTVSVLYWYGTLTIARILNIKIDYIVNIQLRL